MDTARTREPKWHFPASAAGLLFPPVVWAATFALLYTVQGVGCAALARDAEVFGPVDLRLALGALAILAAVAILVVGFWSYRAMRNLDRHHRNVDEDTTSPARFLALLALFNSGLFFVATVWSGAPVLIVDPCSQL